MLPRVRHDCAVAMICAWCHAPIARGPAPAGYACNYGMCRVCLAERLAALAPREERPRRRLVAADAGAPAAPV